MNGLKYAIDLIDKTFGVTIRKAKKDTKGLDDAVNKANVDIAKIRVTGQKSFGGVGKWAKRAAITVASVFATGQILAFGNEITNLEAKFEGFENAITFASGNEAGKNLEFLRNQIKTLSLDTTSSFKGFQTLSGSLKGTSLEGKGVRDIFEAVSIAATSMNLSADQSEGAFLALSQMASKGKVQAEELRGQLGERIPGALNIAAKAMNVTQAQLNKMLDEGKVYAEDFLPKFAIELKKTFQGGLSAAANSMQASINKKNNAILSFKRSTAQMFRPLIINILNSVPKVLKHLESFVKNLTLLKQGALNILNAFSPLIDAFKNIGTEIGGVKGFMTGLNGAMNEVAHVIEILSTGLAVIIKFLKPVAPILAKIIAVTWAWNIALSMNPIGAVILGVVALVGIISVAYRKIGGFRGTINATWEALKGFGRMIKIAIVDRFMEAVKGVSALSRVFSLLKNGEFGKAFEVGKNAFGNILGVESGKKLVAEAKNTAAKVGFAYRKGVWEASQNAKLANPKVSKTDAIGNQIKQNGIFSIPFNAANSNATTNTESNANTKINNKVGTGGGTKHLTVTIHKFVEDINFKMEKGKATTDDIAKAVTDAFQEITADLEKRLINA